MECRRSWQTDSDLAESNGFEHSALLCGEDLMPNRFSLDLSGSCRIVEHSGRANLFSGDGDEKPPEVGDGYEGRPAPVLNRVDG